MVTVVTDDVWTLADYLPRGVRRLSVREFWQLHIQSPEDEEDKRIEADFSAIEEALLALESHSPPGHRDRCRPLGTSRVTDISSSTGSGTGQNEIRAKRERGRLRHERMVKRRGRPR
jgi:hypothetical protein